MKDAQKYIKEAARLSGYKGETPTIDGSGGGSKGLINGEQSNNPYEIMRQTPNDKNLEILKSLTLIDKSGRQV